MTPRKDNAGRLGGFQSTLLVSTGAIAACFVGAILAWWVDASGVAVLLMTVAVLGLISRLWGLYALRDVTVQARAGRETISVGQSVTVRYAIHNNKPLPLVWLELGQDVPPRSCLVPDGSFLLTPLPTEMTSAEGYAGPTKVYSRRFSFLMGHTSMEWETVWTGERRGVYRPGLVRVSSGDGLGLTQTDQTRDAFAGRMLVVWPKIVPVQVWPFLRHVWTGRTGKAGWSEDPTVMRGLRDYQPGDPWKRIDWRTAARTDELMVRQFDTVTPLSVLFILDSKSLEDAEEALSLLASLILTLENQGIDCGLALPATGEKPAILLRPEDPAVTAASCLFALAEHQPETALEAYDEVGIMTAAAESGQVWLVAQGAGSLGCPELAGKLSERGLRLLAARREQGVEMTKIYLFDQIHKKEAAHG